MIHVWQVILRGPSEGLFHVSTAGAGAAIAPCGSAAAAAGAESAKVHGAAVLPALVLQPPVD